MENLKAIEVCEIGLIKVNGVIGKTIFDAAKECVKLANLLKVVVQLHWKTGNGVVHVIDVYTTTTAEDIIDSVL